MIFHLYLLYFHFFVLLFLQMMRLWNRKPDPGLQPMTKRRQPPTDEKSHDNPKSPKPSAKSKKIEDSSNNKKLVYENAPKKGNRQ